MKKLIYLCLFSFALFFACKKNKTSPLEFKFTQIQGNKSSATNGVLKVEWQDDNNTSWKMILTNLTLGTNKMITTSTKSINENIIIGNEYRLAPVGITKPIDTTTPCKGNKIQIIKIGSMPDLFTIFNPCPTAALAISSVFAEKVNATQGLFNAGFVSPGNTSFNVKVTNTITSAITSNTNVAITESGDIIIPLDVPQLVEVTGDQNGAKASFKVLVETNENVVISDFY